MRREIKKQILKVKPLYKLIRKVINKSKGIKLRDGFNEKELKFLLEHIGNKGLVVEIGTFGGETTKDLAKENLVIAIDPFIPDDETGTLQGLYPEQVYTQFMENNKGKNVVLFPMKSSEALVFVELSKMDLVLSGIFVDGLHTYEGVKVDVQWAKYLKVGGIIAFHDSFQEGVNKGIVEFLNENKDFKFIGTEQSLRIYKKTGKFIPEVEDE